MDSGALLSQKAKLEPGDLQVMLSGGVIIRSTFGSLVTLRDGIRAVCGEGNLIYYTISSHPLFVVHWNDLSKKKQDEINGRRERVGKERIRFASRP